MNKTIFWGIFFSLFSVTVICAQEKSLLGKGVDIRFIDPLDWPSSVKTAKLVEGNTSQEAANAPTEPTFHFITTPYEYEREILLSDPVNLPFQASESQAFFSPLLDSAAVGKIIVYTKKRAHRTIASLTSVSTIDSAMVEDFRRLGRDITPEGFVSRYGTHYIEKEVQGGLFVKRNIIDIDDYVYSPYDEKTFKSVVIATLKEKGERILAGETEDPYISLTQGLYFTSGGDPKKKWYDTWSTTVDANPTVIEAVLQPWTKILQTYPINNLDDKAQKIRLLDSIIQLKKANAIDALAIKEDKKAYKKYSIRFIQKLNSIVKKSTGKPNASPEDYTGDIFFGGFSKNDAILKVMPLINQGGLRLETLITDELVNINKNIEIVVPPEDLGQGYVSVWDDTKKLVKSKERTSLRVSGTREAKTYFKDALKGRVDKKVTLTTIDDDIYDVTYSIEPVKEESLLFNESLNYDYVLDSEIIAAGAVGDGELLKILFKKNGNPRAEGLIKTIISNNHAIDVLNLVLDYGAVPTTEDLDHIFTKENFREDVALTLLERGAAPKNNMIYKAVAFKSAATIYALFREGAQPMNNDLAFALDQYHYPTIKALMSEPYEPFAAGKNELLLAAINNDAELSKQFIDLGATADAYILDQAMVHNNLELKNLIVPVTEASSEALEVAAKVDDTDLFSYFVDKEAKLASNKAVEIATDNSNTNILDLALKNGGEANQALAYAIKKQNEPAINITLKNNAKADPVFEYASKQENLQLFTEALVTYDGNPEIALAEAVKNDKIAFVEKVIQTSASKINTSNVINQAIQNENLDMVTLLVENNANPEDGMKTAVNKENIAITSYLITKGAKATDPSLIQDAVQKENLELSTILIDQGKANANDAITDAAKSENMEITQMLLDKGATASQGLDEALKGKNENLILLLLDKVETVKPAYLTAATRKGNLKVVKELLKRGLNPDRAVRDAVRYKKAEVLQALMDSGAKVDTVLAEKTVNSNFIEGAKMMLENKVIDLRAPLSNSHYVLHIVVQNYEDTDIDFIDYLLDQGASINAQNNLGETPLHVAILGGEKNKPLISHLIMKGAATDIKTKDKKTLLDYASKSDIKSFVKKAIK